MRIGRLRNRLTLQTRVGSQNSYMETEYVWTDFATVSAGIEPLQGTEKIAQAQNRGEVTHRIVMRYREGIVSTMRAVFKDRIFIFEAVLNRDERNRELTVLAREVVDG